MAHIELCETHETKKKMYVIKRSGRQEKVHFDKITSRIRKLCYGLNEEYVDPVLVAQKVCLGVHKGVTTSALDELAAETAAHLTSQHPDFGLLAARIAVSNLHKNTEKSFAKVATMLYQYIEPKTGLEAPLLSKSTYDFILEHSEILDSSIIYDRDYEYDYFAFKTLERAYLFRLDGKITERMQHMWMRVACCLHCGNIEDTLETYNLMSNGFFTHASPTLFNAGTPRPQLSSCFLLTIKGDHIEGIYDTLKDCALISKYAGGIGLAVHDIRANGSYIRGTNGTSNGLIPMLRVYNNTARYVDQGGGKRKGAFAIYLEPWHADIFEFLDLRKNHGLEEHRARDLFYGLWVPDLFMKRVMENDKWSLFCPNQARGLADVYGEKFNQLYEEYERKGKARKVIPAQDLWKAIIEAQQETGNPYMLYKDHCNRKSNQQNLGTIRSSNLCTEIIQFTAPDEIAVCNLASIALPKFVDLKKREFDHQKLFEITQVVTKNLNRIIDINYYPLPEAQKSNLRHRPIGIGVQGLADAFILLRFPFESKEAQKLNKEIFETIYFAALTASKELAKTFGPYESYQGCPVSQGILQYDMWNVQPSNRWDWNSLKAEIKQYGVRNSLLCAPMPTASTSQILGNNECFEPYTSNLYVRRTLAGEFICVSKHLLKDLIKLGMWTPGLKNKLIAHNGSVQNLTELPQDIRDLYKTVWEMKGKTLINMAADRAPFIDQSQSLNVHMTDTSYAKMTSLHFYVWKKGLKTGMYYLRTKAATDPIKFTVDQKMLREEEKGETKIEMNKIKTAAALKETTIHLMDNEYPDTELCNESSLNGQKQNVKEEDVNKVRLNKKEEENLICSLKTKEECVSCSS